jgi:regulator of sigma E protease
VSALPRVPRVLGFRWKETDVRLSLLPLGGYVRLAGYNPEDPDGEDPHGFLQQPAWKRLAFYSGGIVANVLITFAILFHLNVSVARKADGRPLPSPLQVLEVTPGMPAAQAGIQPGDQILAFGDLRFPGNTSEEAIRYIQARAGQAIPVTVDRDGTRRALQVTPREDGGKGKLYISFMPTAFQRRPFRLADLGPGLKAGAVDTVSLGWNILGSFGKLVTLQVSPKEIGGPITIIRAGSQAARAGLDQFLWITALISMNLAILNALPIPFLDGGHAAILLFERIRRRDLSVAVKERILTGGFFFLATLMAAVFALDLWKLRR